MRDIAGAEFKFAKTLTTDFFGAGMVEVPPGGAKRIKNSRKMQMVFFVFYGRVMINLGTPPTRFSIGKGGQWQVPRGKGPLWIILLHRHSCHCRDGPLEIVMRHPEDNYFRSFTDTCCQLNLSPLMFAYPLQKYSTLVISSLLTYISANGPSR